MVIIDLFLTFLLFFIVFLVINLVARGLLRFFDRGSGDSEKTTGTE